MARDVNLAIVSGELVEDPVMHTLKNSKRILTFTLKVVEKFNLHDGSPGSHENYLTVEALGRNADTYKRDLVLGQRYQITGYLRVDDINGEERTRIRCFNVQPAD